MDSKERAKQRSAQKGPIRPGKIGGQRIRKALLASGKSLVIDNQLKDWAATLTYNGLLALFPALLVIISLVGIIGESVTEPLIHNVAKFTPNSATEIITDAIENLNKSRQTAGILVPVSFVGAWWSAASYVGAFMRASNAIYEVKEGRPFWHTTPLRLGLTLAMLLLFSLCALMVIATGDVADKLGHSIGISDHAIGVWKISKWPALVVVMTFMVALLYYGAPNVRQPKLVWLSPGSVVAVVLWVAISFGFASYVANFGKYNATYGALAGVIIFIIWLWLSNVAILFGTELNSQLARQAMEKAGLPEGDHPFLEPRHHSK